MLTRKNDFSFNQQLYCFNGCSRSSLFQHLLEDIIVAKLCSLFHVSSLSASGVVSFASISPFMFYTSICVTDL